MSPVPDPGGAENVELGHSAQIDAQEIEVDTGQSDVLDGGNGGLQLLGVHGDGLGGRDFIVVAVLGEDLGSDFLQNADDLGDRLLRFHQNIGDGLTDNGVQRNQNQHGNEAPQAATGHGHAFVLIQLLGQLILLLGVVGVAALNVLNLGGQTGHTHHALFRFGVDGGQNGLHRQSKDNQGNTIVVGCVVQKRQQPAKGNGDDVAEFECKNHWLSSLENVGKQGSRNGVVDIPFVEGIAAQETLQGEKTALPCPVLANCLHGVGAAGRPKPAPCRKKRGNTALIKANERQQNDFHDNSSSRRMPAFFASVR